MITLSDLRTGKDVVQKGKTKTKYDPETIKLFKEKDKITISDI